MKPMTDFWDRLSLAGDNFTSPLTAKLKKFLAPQQASAIFAAVENRTKLIFGV